MCLFVDFNNGIIINFGTWTGSVKVSAKNSVQLCTITIPHSYTSVHKAFCSSGSYAPHHNIGATNLSTCTAWSSNRMTETSTTVTNLSYICIGF